MTSFFKLFKDGQEYMLTWPMEKQLFPIFPEGRVIAATRFGLKAMPPLTICSAFVLVGQFGLEYLPQAITVSAFFLSLPMQGLLWLGHRSNQQLSPAIREWYYDIHQKMRSQGCALNSASNKPKYLELARLLKTAFDELDKVFTKQWF